MARARLVWACALAGSITACKPTYRRDLGTPTALPDGSIGPESGALRKARRFAAKHFKCSAEKIAIQQVDAETFQAGGCGRTATIFCAPGRTGPCEAEDDEPVAAKPTASSASTSTFDPSVVRSSLKSVTYVDCGVGGKGRVQLTIEPNGTTSTVNVVEGHYDEATTRCLLDRFGKVSVPPFTGASRVLRWKIELPGGT